MATITEEYTGASCSGSSGDTGRVLTLANSQSTSSEGFQVFVSGLLQTDTTDYSVVHNNTSSTVTFVVSVYDDQPINVYYQSTTSGGASGITGNDFVTGPINDLGVVVVRNPQTVKINNITGHKEYISGSNENLTVVFENTNKMYSFDKAGLTEGADARIFMQETDTLNKNDTITYGGISYRVDTVSLRRFGANLIFKTVLLFEISH